MNDICAQTNKRKAIDEAVKWLESEDPVTWGLGRRVRHYLTLHDTRERDLLELLQFDSMRDEFVKPRVSASRLLWAARMAVPLGSLFLSLNVA